MTIQEENSEQGQPQGVEELGLKHKTEEQLVDALFEAGKHWSEEHKQMVMSAYQLARMIHAEDSHKDLPYTYHVLRNANRITGYLHITDDPEMIAATILHDAVEDRPEEIIQIGGALEEDPVVIPEDDTEKQRVALEVLSEMFSPRVSELVKNVTNAPSSESKNLTYEEWLDKYVEKVKKAIESVDGFIIKIVDFFDNGLGIVHEADDLSDKKKEHFKVKYGRVVPVFEARFAQDDIQARLDPAARRYIQHQLTWANEILTVEPKAA